MQIRIEQVYWLKFDTEEAEQFLEDASDAQAKIRAAMYGKNNEANETASSAAQRATMLRVAPVSSPKANGNGNGHAESDGVRPHVLPKASSTKTARKPMAKASCPECHREIAQHFLANHRRSAHGVAITASAPSVA